MNPKILIVSQNKSLKDYWDLFPELHSEIIECSSEKNKNALKELILYRHLTKDFKPSQTQWGNDIYKYY